MLRLATPADLDAVHGIYMHPAVVPFLGHEPMVLDAFRPVFGDLLAGGGFHVWEGDHGSVRGFCRAARHPGRAAHAAYLGTFAVHPDERGSGLAATILQAVIGHLQARGVLRVELMVEADNLRAQAFYRRLGFEQEGVLRAAYKRAGQAHYVDECLMARLLAPLPRLDAQAASHGPQQATPAAARASGRRRLAAAAPGDGP